MSLDSFSYLPGHLPCDRHDGGVAELHDPVDLSVHDVHGPLGHETGALSLVTRVLKALHDVGVPVCDLRGNVKFMIKYLRVGLLRRPYLHELDVSVSLATEEAHVGVGVE